MYESIRLITKAYSRLLTPYATPVYDFSKHSWSCGDFWVHGAYENQWVMEDFGGTLPWTPRPKTGIIRTALGLKNGPRLSGYAGIGW